MMSDKEVRESLKPLALDYSALDLKSLQDLRGLNVFNYIKETLQYEQEVELLKVLESDYQKLDADVRKAIEEWAAAGSKKHSQPKEPNAQLAYQMFIMIPDKARVCQTHRRAAEEHLKIIKRFDGIIEEFKKAHNTL